MDPAQTPNRPHLAILKRGVPAWNEWRIQHPNVVPDLSGCDVSRTTNLRIAGADFSGAKLAHTDFAYNYLKGMDLRTADLRHARLINVNLGGSDLRGADLRGANLSRADLYRVRLNGADLSKARLVGTSLVETNLIKAKLTGCSIYGAAVWKVQLKETEQSNLIITPPDEPVITVDNVLVAQFVYLMLQSKQLRDVLDTISSKVVLILGRFTPERKAILDAIKVELRQEGYIPLIFDFKKPSNRDFTETMATLAHMARFVIVDLSDPKAAPHELASVIPRLPSVPFQAIIDKSQKPYGMFKDFYGYRNTLKPFRYRDAMHLISSLQEKVIRPAERLAKKVAGKRSLA